MPTDFEADFTEWCTRRKAEQQARRAARALRMLRVRVRDPLPIAGVWMRGPRWKRAFNLQHRFAIEVEPDGQWRSPKLKFWWYDFTDDVRELACERLRVDVYAMWADPRERWR